MSSSVEWDDREVLMALQHLQSSVGNLSPALREIGETLKESTQQRFSSKTGPDGQAWLGNSDLTIERKGRDHGTLGETIDSQLFGNNGEYRIAYENRGNLLNFVAEIKKGSLFLHAGLPGTGGGQTATSYDYQFRYDGRKMMLIGMETDSISVGFEQPTEDQEFQISVNCLTGMVINSRVNRKPKKMAGLRKVSLEEFDYERGCRGC